MRKMNIIVMTVAGLLLMAAAVLKVHEVMNVAIPSWDVQADLLIESAKADGAVMTAWKANVMGFWESYEFYLIQIPLEFALGAWIVSGLFRKAAWIAGTLAYFCFIVITLIKALLGVESCGCFGQVHVNPWITVFAIDIPFFLLLAIFRPKGYKLLPPPWPNPYHAIACAVPILAVMVLTAPAIVTFRPEFKKPQEQTEVSAEGKIKLLEYRHQQEKAKWQQEMDTVQQQADALKQTVAQLQGKLKLAQAEIEQLKAAIEAQALAELEAAEKQTLVEPDVTEMEAEQATAQEEQPDQQTEVSESDQQNEQPAESQQWEWLEYVVEDDVRQQLSTDLVAVLMYHHDCPTCAEVVPAYSEYYRQMADSGEEGFKIAFLAVPPYAETGPVPEDTTCILGKLTDQQNLEINSPFVVVLLNGELMKTWKQGTAPEPDQILTEVLGE